MIKIIFPVSINVSTMIMITPRILRVAGDILLFSGIYSYKAEE
jgi:hypothetical protein